MLSDERPQKEPIIPPRRRGNQYVAAFETPRITGSSAFADDDTGIVVVPGRNPKRF
jgi:hypothetical protein